LQAIIFVTVAVMKRLKVLIVLDSAARPQDLIDLVKQDVRLDLSEVVSKTEVVDALLRCSPDLIFAHIAARDTEAASFFSIANKKRTTPVIVVSPHEGYAIKAFEFCALDYLLKPISVGRFRRSIDRAVKEIENSSKHLRGRNLLSLLTKPHLSESTDRLCVKCGASIRLLHAGTIYWIEASDQHVKFYDNGNCHLSRASLSQVEAKLDPRKFIRIHRSAIVNLQHVREVLLENQNACYAVLANGTSIRVSPLRKNHFLNALGEIRALKDLVE
jgi:two-component system, LytTR family, response regulator